MDKFKNNVISLNSEFPSFHSFGAMYIYYL